MATIEVIDATEKTPGIATGNDLNVTLGTQPGFTFEQLTGYLRDNQEIRVLSNEDPSPSAVTVIMTVEVYETILTMLKSFGNIAETALRILHDTRRMYTDTLVDNMLWHEAVEFDKGTNSEWVSLTRGQYQSLAEAVSVLGLSVSKAEEATVIGASNVNIIDVPTLTVTPTQEDWDKIVNESDIFDQTTLDEILEDGDREEIGIAGDGNEVSTGINPGLDSNEISPGDVPSVQDVFQEVAEDADALAAGGLTILPAKSILPLCTHVPGIIIPAGTTFTTAQEFPLGVVEIMTQDEVDEIDPDIPLLSQLDTAEIYNGEKAREIGDEEPEDKDAEWVGDAKNSRYRVVEEFDDDSSASGSGTVRTQRLIYRNGGWRYISSNGSTPYGAMKVMVQDTGGSKITAIVTVTNYRYRMGNIHVFDELTTIVPEMNHVTFQFAKSRRRVSGLNMKGIFSSLGKAVKGFATNVAKNPGAIAGMVSAGAQLVNMASGGKSNFLATVSNIADIGANIFNKGDPSIEVEPKLGQLRTMGDTTNAILGVGNVVPNILKLVKSDARTTVSSAVNIRKMLGKVESDFISRNVAQRASARMEVRRVIRRRRVIRKYRARR